MEPHECMTETSIILLSPTERREGVGCRLGHDYVPEHDDCDEHEHTAWGVCVWGGGNDKREENEKKEAPRRPQMRGT